MTLVTALAVGILFGSGVHLMLRRDAIKIAAGTLLLTNAAIVLLIGAGHGTREEPTLPVERALHVADPLVQALALTAVVIAFATTVLLLRVAIAVERTHGTIDMEDLVEAETADDRDERDGRAGNVSSNDDDRDDDGGGPPRAEVA